MSILKWIAEWFVRLWRRPESALMGHYDAIIQGLRDQQAKSEAAWNERVTKCEAHCDECERKLAQTQGELLAIRNLVERLEQQGMVAQIVTDSRGVITEWNPAATTLFHWAREEAIGKNVSIITPHRYRRLHLQAFRKLAETGGEPRREPLKAHAMTRNGLEIPVTVELNGWEIEGKWFYGAAICRRVDA